MAFTNEEIKQKAFQLEQAGAPPEKIRKFVELAVREQGTGIKPQFSGTTLQRGIKKFGDTSGKVLGGLAKFTGIKSAVELAAPAAELLAISGTFLQGETGKKVRKQLLDKPISRAGRVTKERGLAAGIKDVAGQTLRTAAETAIFSKGGLGKGITGITRGVPVAQNLVKFANSFAGRSAEIAFTKSVGDSLQEGDGISEMFSDASLKGISAAGVSTLIGGFAQKTLQGISNQSTKLFGRTLQPPIPKLQADIERGRQTINQKILLEGYSGSLGKMRTTAETNLKKFGTEIESIANNTKGTIFKKDVLKEVNQLIDKNVVLEQSQLKLIQTQIDKIPNSMTVAQANELKIQFAKLVPRKAWDVTASDTDSFRAQLFKSVSGGFRREVETLAPTITVANEKWAIALDVLGLSSKQIARQQVGGGIEQKFGGGVFSSIFRTLTSPFTTAVTRTTAAQILNTIAESGNTNLIKAIIKALIIKAENIEKKK